MVVLVVSNLPDYVRFLPANATVVSFLDLALDGDRALRGAVARLGGVITPDSGVLVPRCVDQGRCPREVSPPRAGSSVEWPRAGRRSPPP